MRKKLPQCKKPRCDELAEIGGFCQMHYDEHLEEERLNSLAVQTLHGGVHAYVITDSNLRDEFHKLQRWWSTACHAVNIQVKDTILMDEGRYAVEWCISLAKEIILADQALKAGKAVSPSLDYTRGWVWDRFSNLEAGLMSNGVMRPEKR